MSGKIYREGNHPGLYYQDMLADRVRMQRYQAAIEAVVEPGMVVADLGTGTGILAMMAARAGAARVHAIEIRSHMIEMARNVIAANGLGDTVRVIHADAADVVLGEAVDVVLNELIGDFGTDENIVESVRGFSERHLGPGGRVVPESLTTWLVPVEYGNEFRGVFRDDFCGFDLRPALGFAFEPHAVMRRLYERATALAPPAVVEDVRFPDAMPPRAAAVPLQFQIERDGSLQGFVGYFESTLAPGITMCSYPAYPGGHWRQWNWPVTPAVAVTRGQRIEARLSTPPRMVAAGWEFEWSLCS